MANIYLPDELKIKLQKAATLDHRTLTDELEFLLEKRLRFLVPNGVPTDDKTS